MAKEVRLLSSVLMVLLMSIVISGGSLAAGDLFNDDFTDCPVRTRLRDGEIADLTVTRDDDEEGEVNVSWTGTDPATWGLGSNAYRASLVVILDDGASHAQDFALGTRKTTFDGIRTGTQVTVEIAVVVDTTSDSYVISDILRTAVNQSLTEPSFTTGWYIKGAYDDPDTDETDETTPDTPVPDSAMYYVGYNENFANYKAGAGITTITKPLTPRLRIGLAHSAVEDDDARTDMDFDSYIVRLTDVDGDVVPEGDDVRTVESGPVYGTGTFNINGDGDTSDAGESGLANALILDLEQSFNETDAANLSQVHNVRVVDGNQIRPAMYQHNALVLRFEPQFNNLRDRLVAIRVGVPKPAAQNENSASRSIYAAAPSEHRDFPIDTFAVDAQYTVEAWAVNSDDEIISPVAKLKVRSIEHPFVLDSTGNAFRDYLNNAQGIEDGVLIITDFTVFK